MMASSTYAGIDLSIDGLVFDGFAQGFADRAAQAFEGALQQALTDASVTDALLRRGSRDLATLVVDLPTAATPEAFGAALAQALLGEVLR